MTMGASRRVVWSGLITTIILVLALGNQGVWDKVLKHQEAGNNSGWWFLSWISAPHFIVSKSGDFKDTPSKMMTAGIVGVLLLFAVTFLFLLGGSRGLAAQGGGFLALVLGWFSLVAGGAVYGAAWELIAGDLSSGSKGLSLFLDYVANGAGYGLITGWVVGIVVAVAYSSGAAAGSSYAAPAPAWSPQPPAAPPSYPPRPY